MYTVGLVEQLVQREGVEEALLPQPGQVEQVLVAVVDGRQSLQYRGALPVRRAQSVCLRVQGVDGPRVALQLDRKSVV